MKPVRTIEEYIEVLKSKLNENKYEYNKSLGLRDGGLRANYYKGRIETLETVIAKLEKLRDRNNSVWKIN